MEDFSNYFQSMIEKLIKSGGGELSFDIKAFDAKDIPDIFKNLLDQKFGDKKENLAVRKLTEEELTQYKELIVKKEQLKSQMKRILAHQKKLEIDFDLFWQDVQESTDKKLDVRKLTVDIDTGFLFEQVNVNKKEDAH